MKPWGALGGPGVFQCCRLESEVRTWDIGGLSPGTGSHSARESGSLILFPV